MTDLIVRYDRPSPTVVDDIRDQLGHPHQALAAGVRPLAPGGAVAGPAFTVTGGESVPAQNGHAVSGPWGDSASPIAQMKGARGLATDGVRGHQVPARLAGQTCEWVTVRPKDVVVADGDGVVVVPQELAGAASPLAEGLDRIGGRLRDGLRVGEDREAVYTRHPKFAHLPAVTCGGRPATHQDSYTAAHRHFLDGLRTGRPAETGAVANRNTPATVLAAYTSAAAGGAAVSVPVR